MTHPMLNNNPLGYRGYITSRLIEGNRTPQHIQNLVIREYAQQNNLMYLLSATEYAIPGCYLALDSLVNNIQNMDGIILFSFFMLPQGFKMRRSFFNTVLGAGKVLHAASEELTILTKKDVERAEDIHKIKSAVARTYNHISSLCQT